PPLLCVDAARLCIDLGQTDVLERYQRWRRFDTMAIGVATNTLNVLFSNKSTLLRTVRDIGLGLVDRAPPLKSLFIRQAAGLSGEVPRLLKGEALEALLPSSLTQRKDLQKVQRASFARIKFATESTMMVSSARSG